MVLILITRGTRSPNGEANSRYIRNKSDRLLDGSMELGVESGSPLLGSLSLLVLDLADLNLLLGESTLQTRSRAADLGTAGSGDVRVKLNHEAKVLKGVLLAGTELTVALLGSEDGLDLVRVDDGGQVRVGHLGAGDLEALLERRSNLLGSVDVVELLEGALSPEDEATQVTTGSETEEVQARDLAQLHTGEVAEGAGQRTGLVVANKGTDTLSETAVPALSGTSTEGLGVLDTLNVIIGIDALEEGDGGLGLLESRDSVIGDDEGNLRNVVDAVTTGHDQGWEGTGSQSGADSHTLLVQVDLAMPSSPDLVGGEHTTTSAHVTEGGLSGAGGSTTGNTGNTGNSATSSPGLSGSLVTSTNLHGVSLTAVLVDVRVNELNNIRTDRGGEDSGESDLGGLLSLSRPNLNKRTCGLKNDIRNDQERLGQRTIG
jgi:hypothetical protein